MNQGFPFHFHSLGRISSVRPFRHRRTGGQPPHRTNRLPGGGYHRDINDLARTNLDFLRAKPCSDVLHLQHPLWFRNGMHTDGVFEPYPQVLPT